MIWKFVRSVLSEKNDDYTFYPFKEDRLNLNQKEAGLYIHIPFCKSMCPYCPYYKISYDQELSHKFKSALILEIKRSGEEIGSNKFTSLYIGGGTPTLMINDLGTIIKEVKESFNFDGPVGIETTPGDLTEDKVKIMKDMGINYVSLGVQSFQQENLDSIGRKYTAQTAVETVSLLKHYHFDTLNIDLIFAFARQKLPQLLQDLQKAVELSPDQITCYPLFTFPYSTIARYNNVRNLKMPRHRVRRNMYYLIHDFLEKSGYIRSSVWSFGKAGTAPYSSVTRDYYLGFGPSAGTYTGEGFYFNVFSVPEYIKTAPQRKPVALEMKVGKRMEKIFWLYWRLYETFVPVSNYKKLYGNDIYADFGSLLKLIKALGFVGSEDEERFVLNKRGCHWIHLAQNYFALNYISKIWSIAQKNTWPGKITL
ncbi:MAG: radical SAM protein [Peptococcaceae bacterium]|nr:MAG: radical SAM protein [Peptococcaceae bacterium]